MSKKKVDTNTMPRTDLRHGQRGTLVQSKTRLVGAESIYALEDPPLASPGFATAEGQTTHQ